MGQDGISQLKSEEKSIIQATSPCHREIDQRYLFTMCPNEDTQQPSRKKYGERPYKKPTVMYTTPPTTHPSIYSYSCARRGGKYQQRVLLQSSTFRVVHQRHPYAIYSGPHGHDTNHLVYICFPPYVCQLEGVKDEEATKKVPDCREALRHYTRS